MQFIYKLKNFSMLKKKINLIFIISLFIFFTYIFITYFCNLCFCENINPLLKELKDFNDCECFKNLKHGEFVKMPINYDPNQIGLIRKIFLKTHPYLDIFYEMVSPFECECHCSYCFSHKFIYTFGFFLAIVLIILASGPSEGNIN
jgi:hypothetical protein